MNMEMNMVVDKQNGNCLYNDAAHVYWDKETNERYTSVTTLIHEFQKPYDADFWSSYKALQEMMGDSFGKVRPGLLDTKKFKDSMLESLSIGKEEFLTVKNRILNDWEINKNNSCERGTAIHLEKELAFYESGEHSLDSMGLNGSFKCERNYYELDLDKGVYPEYLVACNIPYGKNNSKTLRIAGQLDLLIKDGNNIYIVDYKTNKEIKQKSYFDSKTKKHDTMVYPLNNIMDCNYMHYTLQLSLYAYLLQLINPEFVIKQLLIIHYDHSGKETHYELEYKKKDIERMLTEYKKKMALKDRTDKRKKIVY